MLTERDKQDMEARKKKRQDKKSKATGKRLTKARKKAAKKESKYELEERMQRTHDRDRGSTKVEQTPATQELANRELAKRHLLPYVKMFNPDYQAGWVHKDISNRLERFYSLVKKQRSPRIILMVPPRHGKSTLSSKEFPSWVLGNDPNKEIILASYALPLASGFSREVRDRIQYEPQYHLLFPNTKIATDSRGVEEWRLQRPYKGRFQAAGVGGPITGKGADIFIIDDPVKNREEADSVLVQQSTWNWYTSTAYTRLSPGGGMLIILCMTGDTPVTMADGSYKELKEVKPGDKIWAWKDGKAVIRTVLNSAAQGEDDVYEVRTGNAKVRANSRHPFLVRSQKGKFKWVRVEELLTLGQHNCLVHANKLPIEKKKATLTGQEAWLLGYMFGDGWLTRRDTKNYDKIRDKYYPRRSWVTCCAISSKKEENSRVLGLFKAIFSCEPKKTRFGYIRTEIQRVGKWFAEKGLTGKAKTKRLPKYIYSEPLDIRLKFLEGFVEADGSINGRNRVSINLCNRELIEDVRHLARVCGYRPSNINAYKGRGQPPNSPKPIDYIQYNVQWQNERKDEEFYYRGFNVEYVGKETVYDVQIEDAECFFADGLVSHNTRWHEQDLGGRVIDNARKTGEEWDIIRYSAIAEDVEYYDTRKRTIHIGPIDDLPKKRKEEFKKLRDEGDPLHPARYDKKALKRIEETAGPRDWSALYQQRPVAEEGDYIKKPWFWFYTPPNYDGMKHIQAWDLAIGQKEYNNYSVGITGAIDWDNRLHVRDVVRGRWSTMEIAEQVLRKHLEFDSVLVGIEHGHIFLAVEEDLRRLEKYYNVHPTYDDTLKPIHDKSVRARPMQGMIQQRMMIFPEDAEARWPWLFEELLKFPALGRDDGFDTLAWLARMYGNVKAPSRGPYNKKEKSWKDDLKKYRSGTGSGHHLLA